MPFTRDGKYILGRKTKSKQIQDWFDKQSRLGKVTYWKNFSYHGKTYIMTFEYNCYEVNNE